jgi:cold shock protein
VKIENNLQKMAGQLKLHYLCDNYYIKKMSTGTVKFFNESKGFGFITEADSSNEYFVHVSGLIDEIKEGDNVEFELQDGRKGLNAVNVKVV